MPRTYVQTQDVASLAITQALIANQAVGTTQVELQSIQMQLIAAGAVGLTQIELQSIVTGLIRDQAVTSAKIANNAIGLTQIEDGSVTTVKIRDLNITMGKIAGGAVGLTQIEPLSIITALIRDNAVTMPKIGPAAVGLTQIESQSIITGLIRDQAITQAKIANAAVGLTQIEDQSVTTAKIRDLNVTQPKIGPGAVGLTQIELLSIVTALIRDFAVTNSKLGPDCVTADKIADGTVIAVDLSDSSVTNPKLAINAVSTEKVTDSAITNPKLAINSVTTTNITDSAVTQPKIGIGAVGLTQIENQAVTTAKIRDLNVTMPKIANAAVGTTQIELLSIITGLIRDFAVTNAKLGPDSVTSDKIAPGTVIETDIAPSAIDTLELSNSAVTNPKLANNAVTAIKIASGHVVKTIAAYGGLTLTDNVNFIGGPNISVTEQGISNAIKVDVLNLNLSQLSDVTLANPSLNQVLTYNGVQWINGAPVNTSAGSGILFFLNDVATGGGNFDLSTFPAAGAEQTDSVIVNNSTALIEGYVSAALGRTQLDAGVWEFDIYRFVNNTGSVSVIVVQILKRFVGSGTATISGSGTSRTAVISGGTPFLVGVDNNADMTLSGYLETPTQTFQITGLTSTFVATVTTPSGYINESSFAYAVQRHLFKTQTADINNTVVTLENVITVQSAYTGFASTDRLAARYYGSTTRAAATTISMTHDGLTNYSHIHSPLVTRHNDLAGLQGGTSEQYYHITVAELSGLTDFITGTPVVPSSYHISDITVDAKGRVTAAVSGTVGTTDIQSQAVTNSKLATNSVTNTNLSDSSVTNSKIAASTITSDKIASGQVVKTLSQLGGLTLTDSVSLIGGSNIILTTSGLSNTIRIDSTASGSGGSAAVNLLVNGGMEIWQRGFGSFTSGFGPDKWNLTPGSNTAFVIGDASNINSGLYSAKIGLTITSGVVTFEQTIENYAEFAGQEVAFSIMVKPSVIGMVTAKIVDSSGSSVSAANTQNTTFEQLSVTRTIPTGITSLSVRIEMSATGTVYADSAMFAQSSTALSYAPINFASDWERAQRYFEKGFNEYASYGAEDDTTYFFTSNVDFNTVKSISPVVALSNIQIFEDGIGLTNNVAAYTLVVGITTYIQRGFSLKASKLIGGQRPVRLFYNWTATS